MYENSSFKKGMADTKELVQSLQGVLKQTQQENTMKQLGILALLMALSTPAFALPQEEVPICFKDNTVLQKRLTQAGEKMDGYISSEAKAKLRAKVRLMTEEAKDCSDLEVRFIHFVEQIETTNQTLDAFIGLQ